MPMLRGSRNVESEKAGWLSTPALHSVLPLRILQLGGTRTRMTAMGGITATRYSTSPARPGARGND